MTLRTVLIGAVAVAAFVLLLGPWTYVLVTGRPMSVECGGLEPALCEDAWSGNAPGFGPVTWYRFEPIHDTCGETTWGHWWPFYDPLAMTALPLC